MSNFGLLIKALPGILLSIVILAAVVTLVVKIVTGKWPSLGMISGGSSAEEPIQKSSIK